VHAELKQWPEALQDFDTALRLDPEQHEARLQRAALRMRAGDRDGTLDDLQALDQKLAPQANLRLGMAQVYMRHGLPGLALPQLNLWIAVHQNEVTLDSVLNTRCWARALLGVELDKALDDCNEAIDRQPKNAAFLDSRAWVRLRRGELREAAADYDSALKIRPDAAWTLYGRGITRRRLGDAERGGADIDAARRLLPSIDADAGHYGLAADDSQPAAKAP
jgi:tetratricopeptide (TPR) repeat protein